MLSLKTSGPPVGRKYRMGIIFAIIMVAGMFIAGSNSLLIELYSELLTGIGLLYLTFCGGNVSNKWVLGKKGGLIAKMNGDSSSEVPSKDQ